MSHQKLVTEKQSSLPKIWAIEALACSNDVDASLLVGLLKKTPQVSNCIGTNARELVSLRYLESLFTKGARANPESSALSKTVRLDSSDTCEDVLRRILSETSSTHEKRAEQVISKWDLQPFIEHKRSTLRKCALEQLKDAIISGSLSISTSLKEKSGLPVRSHTDHQAPGKDGNCNGVTRRVEETSLKEKSGLPVGSHTDHQTPGKDGNCNGVTRRVEESDTDDGNLLRMDLCDENIAPVNRKQRARGNPAEQLLTNHINPNKKNKHDIISNEEYIGEQCISSGVHKQIPDISAVSVQHILEPHEADTSGCPSPVLGEHNEVLPCGEQVLHRDTEPNKKSEEQQRQEQNVPSTIQTDDEDADISGDGDGYDDEKASIDSKKLTFLSSQCTYSQEATTDWRELHLCMKCDKGGNVLSCTSGSCPLVIHESCLGSYKSFDTGAFYCPFCAYSRAISKYIEVQKCTSLARKDLTTFICSNE